VIQNALDLLKARGVEIDIGAIPLDDEKTYDALRPAETRGGVPGGKLGHARRAAAAEARPASRTSSRWWRSTGPARWRTSRNTATSRTGARKRDSIHPLIDPILDETQGIIVYQEQVMEIAQARWRATRWAAPTCCAARWARRSRRRWTPSGRNSSPAPRRTASRQGQGEEVWDLLDKFANYGFNKSHAAAYGVVSYQTAWLKANHPVEFMAAVMNCDIHLTDKLAVYMREVDRLGIEIVPPCVNRSDAMFAVAEGQDRLRAGALKNVGVEAMRLIEAARGRGRKKPFRDLFDFARRVDLKRIGKRRWRCWRGPAPSTCSTPTAGGCSRASTRWWPIRRRCTRRRPRPGLAVRRRRRSARRRGSPVDDWLPTERLAEEHAAVGFYLSGHPLDDYLGAAGARACSSDAEVPSAAAAARRGGGLGDEAAGAEIGPRQPLRLRRAVGPDRALRGHGVLATCWRPIATCWSPGPTWCSARDIVKHEVVKPLGICTRAAQTGLPPGLEIPAPRRHDLGPACVNLRPRHPAHGNQKRFEIEIRLVRTLEYPDSLVHTTQFRCVGRQLLDRIPSRGRQARLPIDHQPAHDQAKRDADEQHRLDQRDAATGSPGRHGDTPTLRNTRQTSYHPSALDKTRTQRGNGGFSRRRACFWSRCADLGAMRCASAVRSGCRARRALQSEVT
jgi:hypothetical protein